MVQLVGIYLKEIYSDNTFPRWLVGSANIVDYVYHLPSTIVLIVSIMAKTNKGRPNIHDRLTELLLGQKNLDFAIKTLTMELRSLRDTVKSIKTAPTPQKMRQPQFDIHQLYKGQGRCVVCKDEVNCQFCGCEKIEFRKLQPFCDECGKAKARCNC